MSREPSYIEPREWSCLDDSPLNNGWGYDGWNNPIDCEEEEEEINEDENYFENEL